MVGVIIARVLMTIGAIIGLFGAGCMDSEWTAFPYICMGIGAVICLVGFLIRRGYTIYEED